MTDLGIPGVKLSDLLVHEDLRGAFVELFRADQFDDQFVQANRSRSAKGVLRGLHFHRFQADLWHVVAGEIVAVLVDLRVESDPPNMASVRLRGSAPQSLYIPAGVAHGFRALVGSELIYWVTNQYDASDELGIAWDDPLIAADWGPGEPILSERDANNPRLVWNQIPTF